MNYEKKAVFEKGHKKGRGRPPGKQNRSSILLKYLNDDDEENIMTKIIGAAKNGDMVAIRFIMERLDPPPKDRLIQLDIPSLKLTTQSDAIAALGHITEILLAGEITASECAALSAQIQTFVSSITEHDHGKRLLAIEDKTKEFERKGLI